MVLLRIERLVDDLEGGPAHEIISFAVGAERYEIHLNRTNAQRFRKLIDPYVRAAQRIPTLAHEGRRESPDPSPQLKRRGFDLAALRQWAAQNHVDVPARGRIPNEIVRRYKAAGGR